MIPKQIATLDGKIIARLYMNASGYDWGLEWEDPSDLIKQGKMPPKFITRDNYTILKRMVEKHYPGAEWRNIND